MKPLALLAALALAGCSSVTPTPTTTPSPTQTLAPSTAPSLVPTPSPVLDVFETPLPTDVVERLENVLAEYGADESVKSMSAAVLDPAAGYWQDAIGLADPGSHQAATTDTVYPIGSITETFVAALILRLYEQGFLDLDAAAADYLGPLGGEKSNGATVRELLTQRSGIRDYVGLTDHDLTWTLEGLLNQVGPPLFEADTRSEFSATNYLLLGVIAESTTGGPLGELLHEQMLVPLDLSRTYYTFGEKADQPIAHGFFGTDGPLFDVGDGGGQPPTAKEAAITRGSGAMASSAPDLVHWMHALCAGDVLGPESQSRMFTFDANEGWGMGVAQVSVAGSVGLIAGMTGNTAGWSASAYCDEDTGIVIVVLSSGFPPNTSELLEAFFGAAKAAD